MFSGRRSCASCTTSLFSLFYRRLTLISSSDRLVVVVIIITSLVAFLSDGNLDTLCGETLAEFGTVADTRELFGRVHQEHIAKNRGQNRRLSGCFDVHKRKSKSVSNFVLALMC